MRFPKLCPWYVFTVQMPNYDTLTKSTSDATDTRDRYCKLRWRKDIDRDVPIPCRTFDLDSKLHGESDKAIAGARNRSGKKLQNAWCKRLLLGPKFQRPNFWRVVAQLYSAYMWDVVRSLKCCRTHCSGRGMSNWCCRVVARGGRRSS